VQINCVKGDPGIISLDVKNANFMDTSAGALFMAATDKGSIGGGANYTVPDAGDNVENIFKSIGDCEGVGRRPRERRSQGGVRASRARNR
jgi:hypothetical protein